MATTERVLRPRGASPSGAGSDSLIVAPGQLYVSGEDFLRVRAWTAQTGVEVGVHARFLLPDGSIQALEQRFPVTSDRVATTADVQLGRGYLLNVAVRPITASVLAGQCYFAVSLQRGQAAAGVPVAALLGGYATTSQPLGWPGSPILSSTEGQGWLKSVKDLSGRAADDYVFSVPTGARWRLTNIRAQFQCGGGAGTRYMLLVITDANGASLFHHVQLLVMPALNGANYTWARGAPNDANPGGQSIGTAPLPLDLDLLAGALVSLQVLGFQAGDAYLAVNYAAVEWLEAA